MNDTWSRIERWLQTNAPEVFATLVAPSTDDQLDAAEQQMGVSFSVDLRGSLLVPVHGVESGSLHTRGGDRLRTIGMI